MVYKYGSRISVEPIESYTPGGLHPVHLGDKLKDGCYRIYHKLGVGGFAAVWLARDKQCVLPLSWPLRRSRKG